MLSKEEAGMCCKSSKCFGGATQLTVCYANEANPRIENIHTLRAQLHTGRGISVLSRRGWTELIAIDETGHDETFELPDWTLLLTTNHKMARIIVGGALEAVKNYPHTFAMGRTTVYDVITTGKDALAGPYIVQVTTATAKQILERGKTECSKRNSLSNV